MVKRWFALSALFLCLSLQAVWAQAPSTIGYQGVLTDNSGVAVANGSYSLSFSLYTAASGGSALWTETQSVTTTSGVFNVVLGSVTPLNIAFNQPLYLGISVGGIELSPRIALNAAPYSLMAKGVEDGAVSSSKLGDSAVTSLKIQDGAVATADLANSSVTTTQIADGTVTAGDINSGQVVKSVNALTDAVTLVAGSNVSITPSGNTLTIAATGASLADGAVTTAKLADNAVTSAKVVDGTVTTADLADNAVTGAKVASGQVVKSLNALTDAVTLAAGSNVTITPSGNTLTIAVASASGNTLDQAYDQGGAGAGRTITADAGAVDIAGSGGLTVNGNVGIGTTSPGYPLEIRKDQNSITNLVVNNGTAGTTAGAQVIAMREGGQGIGMAALSGSFTASGINLPNSGKLRTDSGLANGLILATGGSSAPIILAPVDTERLRIDASGNVGIGTTSPGYLLTLNSATKPWINLVRGASDNTFMGIADNANDLLTNSASGDLVIRSEVAKKLHLGTADGGLPIGLTVSNGNVGIGTTSPGTKLHILGGGWRTEVTSGSLGSEMKTGETAAHYNFLAFRTGVYNATSGYTRSNAPWEIGVQQDGNGSSAATDRIYLGRSGVSSSDLVVSRDGNVGIGTTSPANLLTVQQTSATDPIADAWTTYSSRRWKTNVQPLSGSLDKVQRLRGVSYQWKANGQRDIGLIAEEVGQVIPEVVAYEENGKDAKSVDYARLVAVLIEAVKEQQRQIEAQRARIEALERDAGKGRFSAKAGE